MSTDYTWSDWDTDILNKKVPITSLPQRFTLTGTCVIQRATGANKEILLVNPHPKSWNNWLLPYGSLSLPADSLIGTDVTFKGLTRRLVKLQRAEHDEYLEAVQVNVRQELGWHDYQIGSNPFFSNYSLKFSKSANVWTAYHFSYYLSTLNATPSLQVESAWLPIDDSGISAVLTRRRYADLAVAANVLDLLSNDNNLKALRD